MALYRIRRGFESQHIKTLFSRQDTGYPDDRIHSSGVFRVLHDLWDPPDRKIYSGLYRRCLLPFENRFRKFDYMFIYVIGKPV